MSESQITLNADRKLVTRLHRNTRGGGDGAVRSYGSPIDQLIQTKRGKNSHGPTAGRHEFPQIGAKTNSLNASSPAMSGLSDSRAAIAT